MSPSGVRLLDVNLLVALAWPHHVRYSDAQRWFATIRSDGWATTPMTEAGLARLSMNPLVAGGTTRWSAVLDLIGRIRQTNGHHGWTHDNLTEDPVVVRSRIVGHRQVTDVLLAAVAARHGGRLATIDSGVSEALHPDDRHVVEVVPAQTATSTDNGETDG